jgi:hypothetical protein
LVLVGLCVIPVPCRFVQYFQCLSCFSSMWE